MSVASSTVPPLSITPLLSNLLAIASMITAVNLCFSSNLLKFNIGHLEKPLIIRFFEVPFIK